MSPAIQLRNRRDWGRFWQELIPRRGARLPLRRPASRLAWVPLRTGSASTAVNALSHVKASIDCTCHNVPTLKGLPG